MEFLKVRRLLIVKHFVNNKHILSEHIELGIEGEEMATQHLQDQHYEILARNWRFKRAEIDIIAQHQGTLVFVEVKTRSYVYLCEPEESVKYRKQDLLVYAAAAYMREHNHDWAYRFDIITLIKENEQRFTIKHMIDAFEPRLM